MTINEVLVEEVAPHADQFHWINPDIAAVLEATDERLSVALDAQGGQPEAARFSAAERLRLIDALMSIWEAGLEGDGLDLGATGPEAIARNATPEEQNRVSARVRERLREEAGGATADAWRRRAIIAFLSRLSGDAGLSDEDLLQEYSDAELWEEAAEMLLKTHRVEEAISLAARRLLAAPVLLRFASRLVATGEEQRITQAITLVDDRLWEREGLNVHDDQALRQWLEEWYIEHGNPEKSLALARGRFSVIPDKREYDAVKAIALHPDQPGAPWPALRKELLASLRTRGYWNGPIGIYLDEGEVAEALAVLERAEKASQTRQPGLRYGWATFPENHAERVAAAAEGDYPEDAVQIYRRLADRQIAGRKRETYRVAASHLARVKQVLEEHGQPDAWSLLITDLRQEYKRLRALREELDFLGLR